MHGISAFYRKACRGLRQAGTEIQALLKAPVYFGRFLQSVPAGSVIICPVRPALLCCGLSGIVSFKKQPHIAMPVEIPALESMATTMESCNLKLCQKKGAGIADCYLGGQPLVDCLYASIRRLKLAETFAALAANSGQQRQLTALGARLDGLIGRESSGLADAMGYLASSEVDCLAARLDALRDAAWCLNAEVLDNIAKVAALAGRPAHELAAPVIALYQNVNAVLNSIDRLEVRGRDSAGISLLFVVAQPHLEHFRALLEQRNLAAPFNRRIVWEVLANNCISIHACSPAMTALAFTYKVAAEIGSLGDNVSFLRAQIKDDAILHCLTDVPLASATVSAHTRWASVGAISEANCHPVDSKTLAEGADGQAIIHVCLNGDIDNYQELKNAYEQAFGRIPEDITTDTKIIPLQIRAHLARGCGIQEAFRLAVNDFTGSHAISMHTDLAPGKIFLAQRGSGQALFVGIGDEAYMPTSEVYGFVEQTPRFVKVDAERMAGNGSAQAAQGQIVILDQESFGGLQGLTAMLYDGTAVALRDQDIQVTDITTRDIDRQGYPHYFLKEISEAPASVEKTLQNRWKVKSGPGRRCDVSLDERAFPGWLRAEVQSSRIRRIFFVGQGTAGVAAQACAHILGHYIHDDGLQISSLKSSELSGFSLDAPEARSMADCLVVAITQSGTTADTNRTVDMIRERGGRTIAIVNRRDSDITFKVDGVLYTSSGRDIEMSVASTKAFYSQIVAGALLGLCLAQLKGCRDEAFVSAELGRLLKLPEQMRAVIALTGQIEASARLLAPTRTYWAAVGSGPNKAAADEIRIKLSELCYKTISSDFVEDKKHIDLSSEPLILVCAAGTRDTVVGDIVKDTAIFQAHKALPIVIANQGDERFAPYAAHVFAVPPVSEHLAPILNTLAGHLWGYYAALAINEGSRLLYDFRSELQRTLGDCASRGLDVYEVVLAKTFRESVARFYAEFRQQKAADRLPTIMGIKAAANLTLLLKYLAGRLPASDFEIDFGRTGTPLNMLNMLLECLGDAINGMARPVDAIKHQAKTVTVGTSRISERLEGLLFDAVASHGINVSRITSQNIVVLKNVQDIIARVRGTTLYRISNLDLLGEPTDDTTIEVVQKTGELLGVASRVDRASKLQGTKRIIAREGNVYIGRGLKDGRSILIIPVIPASSSAPGMVEHMLLLYIAFKDDVARSAKKKALGGKYERIKNIVQESSVEWEDGFLDRVATPELFGSSAEKLAESILQAARPPEHSGQAPG